MAFAVKQNARIAATKKCSPTQTMPSLPLRKAVVVRFQDNERDNGLGQQTTTTDRLTDDKYRKQNPIKAAQKTIYDAIETKPGFDPEAPKYDFTVPVFSRRREIYAGRLAILGFTAAGFWEWFLPDHPNIMQQIAKFFQLSGIPVTSGQVGAALLLFVVAQAIPALSPDSPTWNRENQEDVRKRPEGPTQTSVSPTQVKKFLGISGWGFSKKNELFVGRMAMLGFAAALLQQVRMGGWDGPGYIAQVASFLRVDTDQAFWDGIPVVFWAYTAIAFVLAYANSNPGTVQGEEDIY